MASIDFLADVVGTGLKLRADPMGRLNLRIGEQYVTEMDISLDTQRLIMIKKLKKLIKEEKAAADSDQDIIDAYKDMLKSYKKQRANASASRL